jgi:outer membrane protein TolC
MKKPFARPLLAAVLAGIIAGAPVSPAFAQQQQPQQPPPKPLAQEVPPTPGPQAPAQGTTPISLGVSKFDYTHGPKAFPSVFRPYQMQYVEPGELTNSPRLGQLIHDGKLNLSLQDSIALALENSMDIVVQRYNPWLADASILKTHAGGFAYGVPQSLSAGSTANVPNLFYDPVITHVFQIADLITPVNNPFTSGVGPASTNSFLSLPAHSASYNTQYTQSFTTGTTITPFWNNTRSSNESTFNFFNPAVQSTLGITVSQQLLQGAGRFINRRNILIAENNRKIADLAFAQQAITTVTNTINAYWELAYARENVNVQQQAVTVAEKLYNDNKKQLEIGTMAPLDVTRAESELATDRQNLIVAQTTKLQDELVLKNSISKDPLASDLINVEIIPTDKPDSPSTIQTASFEDAVKEAFDKRPDLKEQYLNLKNGQIDVRATKNALLPIATLSLNYSSTSLAGNAPISGTPVIGAGSPVVGADGVPVTVLDSAGNPIPIFLPSESAPIVGVSKQGFTDAMTQVFHNRFPTYAAGVNVTLPLRNRAAQADSIHAQLTERQLEAQTQQLKNTALLDVRNTTIALEQGRAQVQAASKARELQQQTFDAEQKKYQLGASTVYNVILTQRDLITAQGTELRALANLAEAKANYERALGRTLEVNSVSIAGLQNGQNGRDTNIPGTNSNGQVVGTDELFRALDQQGGKSRR